MDLRVGSEVHGDWRVIAVAGELDIDTVPVLATRMEEEVTAAQAVVDLGGVSFMDSTGLALMLEWHRRLAEKGGRLRIACPQAPVRKLFRLADVADVLDVHESVAQACHVSSAGEPSDPAPR